MTETRKMTDAERERADGLKNLQIQSQVNIGNSQVAMDKIALDTRKQLRQESDAQAIQDEKAFEDRLTQIQADAIQQRIQLEKAGTNDPVKIATLNAQLEDLERTHQEKLTQLDADATVERQKYATDFSSKVQDTFATFFSDLTDRTKKLSDTFKSLFSNLMKNFNDVASKQLAEKLLGGGTSGGSALNAIATKLFGGSLKSTPASDPTTQALTGLTTATDQANTSMQALSTDGIGGMFKSASDWITKQLASVFAQQAQTNASQTLVGGLTVLTQSAYSAATALSTIQASGAVSAGSGGAGALKGLAGLFGKPGPSANTSTALASDDAVMANSSAFSDMGVVPYLAEGTNFVPQDMLAMIHKGERVTPAKYNHDDAGRKVTIYQTNMIPQSTSRASAAQTGAAVANATSQAMRRNS